MKIKIISPVVIKNIDPIFSPISINRVIKGQNGIVVIKNTNREIDYNEITLLSVFSQKVPAKTYHDSGITLLIFLKDGKRPFVLPASKIDFSTFSTLILMIMRTNFQL